MKQLLLTLFLLTAVSYQYSAAQTRIPRELHFGVVGGANLSEYTFYPRVSQQYTPSYTAGVAMRYIEETYFGLQAELHLTRRAFADDFTEIDQSLHYTRMLTYLELPVMAHVYFKAGERNEVAFDIGPKFAYFLFDGEDSNLPADYGREGSEYYGLTYIHHDLPIEHKVDYGIQAGLGYEFKFSKKVSLQLQGRYYYGLGNLWPDSKIDDFEQSSNQSIQIVMSLWWHHTIRGKKIKR